MIGVILIIAAAILMIVIPFIHGSRIRHGKCPVCGAPIEEYGNENFSGLRCTKCKWYLTN